MLYWVEVVFLAAVAILFGVAGMAFLSALWLTAKPGRCSPELFQEASKTVYTFESTTRRGCAIRGWGCVAFSMLCILLILSAP